MAVGGEREQEKLLSRSELVSWVRARLESLEEECRVLRSLLAELEGRGATARREAEKSEWVLAGKRKIARIYYTGSYVRLEPGFPARPPEEAIVYLERVVAGIRERQAEEGIPPEEQARLRVEEGDDGVLVEARIEGLHSTIDFLRAKAALKYLAEISWELYKAQRGAQ